MNVTCDNCLTRLNIPEDKLPKDKPASFRCPKCKEKVTVQPKDQAKDQAKDQPKEKISPHEPTVLQPPPPAGPEQEGRKALVCVKEKNLLDSFRNTLERNGFVSRNVEDAASALKLMEYKMFELLIIDESFDGGRGAKKVIQYLNGLDMSVRRKICVMLLSRKLETANSMAALHMSVNYIINHNDLDNFENVLFAALQEQRDMYSVFREVMDKTGKI